MIPYVFAEVEESMCKAGGDGCKGEAVGNGESCGKEDGAIGLVSLEVEGGIGIDDLRDVGVLQKPVFREGGKKENGRSDSVLRREWER